MYMSEFLKMDIFFFVATIGTIVLTTLLSIALFYCIRVVKGMERILGEIEDETKAIRADLGSVRDAARREGEKLSGMLQAFEAMLRSFIGKKPRTRKKKAKTEQAS